MRELLEALRRSTEATYHIWRIKVDSGSGQEAWFYFASKKISSSVISKKMWKRFTGSSMPLGVMVSYLGSGPESAFKLAPATLEKASKGVLLRYSVSRKISWKSVKK